MNLTLHKLLKKLSILLWIVMILFVMTCFLGSVSNQYVDFFHMFSYDVWKDLNLTNKICRILFALEIFLLLSSIFLRNFLFITEQYYSKNLTVKGVSVIIINLLLLFSITIFTVIAK